MKRFLCLVGITIGLLVGAGELLAQTDERTTRLFDYYFQEALRLEYQKQYADAFELFKHCIALDSTQAAPYAELSLFYQIAGDETLAMHCLMKSFLLDPENKWYCLQLAAKNDELGGNIRLTTFLIETLLSQNDYEATEAYYYLANLYSRQGSYKLALQTLNRLENLIGITEELCMERFELYLSMGKKRKAVDALEELSKKYENNPRYLVLLANAYLVISNDKKALECYRKADAIDPNNGDCLRFLANYYEQKGDTLRSEEYRMDILRRPSVDVENKMGALSYFMQTHPNDSAMHHKLILNIIDHYPNDYQIRNLYVRWLLAIDNKEMARHELRNVLDMDPSQLQVWKDYLSLHLELNDFERCQEICREALDYFPEESLFWYYSASIYASERRFKEALEAYEKCLHCADPNNKEFTSTIHGYMGDILHEQGDEAAAFSHYEKAIEENPSNELVLNNYAYFLALKEDRLDEAERLSRQSLKTSPTNSTFLDTYAWILFKQGNYAMAKVYIERAFINDSEGNAELIEHYGDILWFCDEQDAAVLEWMKAAELQEHPSESLLKKIQTKHYH